jgi:hypothetical protein
MNGNAGTARKTSLEGGAATSVVKDRPFVSPAKTRRLNINLPEAKFVELEGIAKDSNRTMTDVVRLALELVKVAVKVEANGHRLAVVDEDGNLIKELVLLC